MDDPILTLGGEQWPVPPLAIAQLRHVVPAVLRLGRIDPTQLDEAAFDDLITVILWGLRRTQPGTSREQVLALQATAPELFAAAALVSRQTGMLTPGAGDTPPGESLTP